MNEEKGLPAATRKYLAALGKTNEEIDELAANMAGKAQAAQEAGIESKEATPEAEPTTEAQPDTPTYATTQEVADAVLAIAQPLMDTINNLTTQLTAVQAEVKALKETDAAKIAEKSAATPQASLQALIARSLTGMEAAQLDGRSTLAKAGPKQAESKPTAVTGIGPIDEMIAASRAAGVTQ